MMSITLLMLYHNIIVLDTAQGWQCRSQFNACTNPYTNIVSEIIEIESDKVSKLV